MAKVIILRGLPGSGKTTHAKTLKPQAHCYVVSADSYFTNEETGEYNFDPARLSEAHGQCIRRAVYLMENAELTDTIVIDNTNTTAAEIAPYYALAEAFGHVCEIRQFDCPAHLAWQRNKHGVPLEAVQRMALTLESERLPPWWKVVKVETP